MAVTQWTDGVINSLSSLKIGSPKPPLKKEVFCYNVFGKCYNMSYIVLNIPHEYTKQHRVN